jgi:hypothetical protein
VSAVPDAAVTAALAAVPLRNSGYSAAAPRFVAIYRNEVIAILEAAAPAIAAQAAAAEREACAQLAEKHLPFLAELMRTRGAT